MTTKNTLEESLLDCSRFRWIPGMLAVRVKEPPFLSEGVDGSKMLGLKFRVVEVTKIGSVYCVLNSFRTNDHDFAPDLTDPATLGCLLLLVREAWNDYTITTQFHPSTDAPGRKQWRVWQPGNPIAYGLSEPEALVSALEQSLLHSK